MTWYTLYEMKVPDGSTHGYVPRGVNAKGHVTGWAGPHIPELDHPPSRAFRYEGAVIEELPGEPRSWGNDINGAEPEQIVGRLNGRAALWTNGKLSDLQRLVEGAAGHRVGGSTGEALGINDSGLIVGVANAAAFMFDLKSGKLDSDFVSDEQSRAMAVNAAGHVVGGATAGGHEHAFLYDGKLHNLQAPGSPFTDTVATAINGKDQVVGTGRTAAWETHAFLWSAKSGMKDLGTLGGPHSWPNGISDAGVVVGNSTTAGLEGTRAFICDGGAMHDLSVFVYGGGWVLWGAGGISANGCIVTDGSRSVPPGGGPVLLVPWEFVRVASYRDVFDVKDLPDLAGPRPGIDTPRR